MSPSPVTFGAVGSTRQLAAAYKDANGTAVSGAAATFSLAGSGATASVSTSGLVTALAPGTSDTVVASGNGFTARAPIAVVQVPAVVTVSSSSNTPDTLFAATRTRQFSAAVKDSNNNAIAAPAAWSSGTSAATVDASGLVTAVADGSGIIQATAGAASGTRPIVIRRLVATHTIAPATVSISVDGDSVLVTGAAADSAGKPLPLSWAALDAGLLFRIATVNATSIYVHPLNNVTDQLIMSAPSGIAASALVAITNQTFIPVAATVTTGDDFFTSARNTSSNPAVDTIRVGGQVTWNFAGVSSHNVQSTSSPGFASSPIKLTGTFALTFTEAGSYAYNCILHGNAMTGIIVVR